MSHPPCLLDTNILLATTIAPERLPTEVVERLHDSQNVVFFSAASIVTPSPACHGITATRSTVCWLRGRWRPPPSSWLTAANLRQVLPDGYQDDILNPPRNSTGLLVHTRMRRCRSVPGQTNSSVQAWADSPGTDRLPKMAEPQGWC